MINNPEFRRNLWLELTPYRLVGMPLVLGAIFLLVYFVNGRQVNEQFATTAVVFYGILSFLWGTRLASESVVSEIRDHTWDNQRMSSVGPWEMTWGKLLGSTIYPWYGAALCLLVYLLAQDSQSYLVHTVKVVVLLLASGLFSQGIALLSSMQAIRKDRNYSRSQAAAFLVLGVLVVVPVLSLAFDEHTTFTWYGTTYEGFGFVLITLLAFLAWTVTGIYRLMRSELQIQNGPWIWLCFVLFLMGYGAGFVTVELSDPTLPVSVVRLLLSFAIAALVTYAMAFSERKDPVAWQRLLRHFRMREWRSLLDELPCWTITLGVTLLTVGFSVLYVSLPANPAMHGAELAVFIVSMAGFVLRDLGLLLFFNLGRNPKRADMLTVLYLALLYGVIPTILAAVNLDLLTTLFWPRKDLQPILGMMAVMVEVLVMSWLVARRWRVNYGERRG